MRKYIGRIKNESKAKIYKRKLSIRKKIIGSLERPRICAIKSNKNLKVDVINDATGETITSISTFGKNGVEGASNLAGAKNLGIKVAEQLKSKNFSKAVFDRNGRNYSGAIKLIAETIRENGISI